MITILVCVVIWYVVSETLAWLLCALTGVSPVEYEEDHIYSLRAGIFMAPALIPLVLLALATWWLLRIAHAVLPWLVQAPDQNPMEYLL